MSQQTKRYDPILERIEAQKRSEQSELAWIARRIKQVVQDGVPPSGSLLKKFNRNRHLSRTTLTSANCGLTGVMVDDFCAIVQGYVSGFSPRNSYRRRCEASCHRLASIKP
jgi:hypothetical protein